MYKVLIVMSTLVLPSPALAGTFDSGSDGSDGALNCESLGLTDCETNCTEETPCEVQIDLALATTASWDTPSPQPGKGVYDANEWAVVFKYTTIDIPAFVTVTFHNHPKGAPVMWLGTGNVTIAGSVRLDGADGSNVGLSTPYAVPGPGGFSGGFCCSGGSAGFGPGGGPFFPNPNFQGGGGGYGSAGGGGLLTGGVIYGTTSIVPLIGGSGGSFGSLDGNRAGGAGGGAILIASSGSITLDSTGGLFATGGNASGVNAGGGSGGGIRLIANDTILGSGILRAPGGATGSPFEGGDGRIRVEATSDQLVDRGVPTASTGFPGSVFPDTSVPSLRVTAINGKPIPTDPLATVASPDVAFTAEGPVTIDIEAQNVPVGLTVKVRIVQALGAASFLIPSTPLVDDGKGGLTATAEFDFTPPGSFEVQLSVQLP